MAWGMKVMRFESGAKVKVANTVLEALHSQIIKDYISVTTDQNLRCTPEARVRVFSASTYRRWLKVSVNSIEIN